MIIWGTKRVVSSLGFVADFCPICREVRTFEVERIGMAGHLYYLSFGSGTLAGYVRTCRTCGTGLNATPDMYARLSREMLRPDELQPITFPNLNEVHGPRLAMENRSGTRSPGWPRRIAPRSSRSRSSCFRQRWRSALPLCISTVRRGSRCLSPSWD